MVCKSGSSLRFTKQDARSRDCDRERMTHWAILNLILLSLNVEYRYILNAPK